MVLEIYTNLGDLSSEMRTWKGKTKTYWLETLSPLQAWQGFEYYYLVPYVYIFQGKKMKVFKLRKWKRDRDLNQVSPGFI